MWRFVVDPGVPITGLTPLPNDDNTTYWLDCRTAAWWLST